MLPSILRKKVEVIVGSSHPNVKLNIVGAGIIGALEVLLAHLEANKKGESIRVTVYDKNATLADTTISHLVPSLTDDEIVAVVPRGDELVHGLQTPFTQPGGVRVDDIPHVNDSEAARIFIEQVKQYSLQVDETEHQARTKSLLELGRLSMKLWQRIYDEGDEKLQALMREANFQSCHEPKNAHSTLHDGYRIDLINAKNATDKAAKMRDAYTGLGYQNCKILSPAEVMRLDPSLIDYCHHHSDMDERGERQWKQDVVALWRPGGCIDTNVFLPKLYEYLAGAMGEYKNEKGIYKKNFRLKLSREVIGVTYQPESNGTAMNGLRFFGRDKVKHNKHAYKQSDYVFCPGESVDTLNKLGFDGPAYAGFAGASLKLTIPLSEESQKQYADFNHCMEVHRDGVVLAWQGRRIKDKVLIGVAGTKAFYGDQMPRKDQAFARNRCLLELNIINSVLPALISQALGRDTKGKELTDSDLAELEQRGIAETWVGRRAVACDGYPTLGRVHRKGRPVQNAHITTHLGSGGVAFAPAAVFARRQSLLANEKNEPDNLIQRVLRYAHPTRKYGG